MQSSQYPRREPVSRDQRFLWSALKLVACSVSGLALFIGVRSYRSEAANFSRQRHAVPVPAEVTALDDLQAVRFPSRDGTMLGAWYLPSRNRCAIVLAHGSSADRRGVLGEALALYGHGFGALLYDSPGHGESEGEIHFGSGERAALVGAVDFLAARPDVDRARIGAFGFSMGGYVLAQVASEEQRVKAIVLAGAPSDAKEQTRWEYRKWGLIAQLPALFADRRQGFRFDELRPKDVVSRISPRPLLVIGGSNDEVVPLFMTEELFASAGEPKELLVVPGAGHGSYAEAAPGAYPSKLISFFERTLLGAVADGSR